MNVCHFGDCRDVMRRLIAEGVKVQTCVTSPPYWALRDYGHPGQLGLEPTIEEYIDRMVDVFRLVRDLLADDGTLWLNMGDSYASAGGAGWQGKHGQRADRAHTQHALKRKSTTSELKPKDLMMAPARLALALQRPYYTGKVKDEIDRVWLAAMVDAEGSICGTEYTTNDRTKTNIYISVTNTSVPIINKCEKLFPQDIKHIYEKSGPSSRVCYRWDVERMDTKALFVREIYPYLVAKKKQAIVAYTFLELQRGLFSKKKGYLPEQQEQRSWLMAALSKLNAGEDIDLPGWVVEPPPLFEPGFYLRQDIIWHKPNPMPESVTDRCTKSHEYLFLLSKSERYYFDQEAILEPVSLNTHARLSQDVQNQVGSARANGGAKTNGNMKAVGRKPGNISPPKGQKAYEAGDERHRTKAGLLAYAERTRIPAGWAAGTDRREHRNLKGNYTEERKAGVNPKATQHSPGSKQNESLSAAVCMPVDKRNKRSVWTVATKSYSGAHFATFPPALIEPCILAGSRPGDIVLDPFGGSGTTAQVAQALGRKWILCELNEKYKPLIENRTRQPSFDFQQPCDTAGTDRADCQVDLPVSQLEIDERA